MRTKTRKIGGVLEVDVTRHDPKLTEALAVLQRAFTVGLGVCLWPDTQTISLQVRTPLARAEVEAHEAALTRYESAVVAILTRLESAPQWRDRRLSNCRLV